METVLINNIDFELLRNQKAALLSIEAPNALTTKQYYAIDGMICLIDAIQDYAVDVLGKHKFDIYLLSDGQHYKLFNEFIGKLKDLASECQEQGNHDDYKTIDRFAWLLTPEDGTDVNPDTVEEQIQEFNVSIENNEECILFEDVRLNFNLLVANYQAETEKIYS